MALKWKKSDLLTLAEKKVQMANDTCQGTIYNGIDVELTTGTEHFSLEPNDQTNIDSMFTAVTLGATQYPYHSDGAQCQDVLRRRHRDPVRGLQDPCDHADHYCNFLKIWINRETSKDVLAGIVYGSTLPDDLLAEMNAILASAQEEIQSLIGKLTQALGE